MKKKTVGEVPGNVLGMLAGLMLKIQNGVITPRQLGRFCKKQNPFKPEDYSAELIFEWVSFYKRFFGREYDFSNVFILEKPNVGHWRLLIIADLTLRQLYAKCKERFDCKQQWINYDLDEGVTWNERDAKNGAYAIWVKDEIEANEELKSLSAKAIKVKNITTETLAERLIHGFKFFDETGKHLDVQSWTLCTGSRFYDDNVPSVGWRGGKMNVGKYDAGIALGNQHSRQVVS